MPYVNLPHGASYYIVSYCFGFVEEILSSFVIFFGVYYNNVIFSSVYSLYLYYEHGVLITL